MRNITLVATLLALPAVAQTDLETGASLVHARRFDEARATYERVLSVEPSNVEAHVRLCRLYAEQLDDVDKAIQLGEAAVRLAPADARAHFALGEAYGLKAADVGVFAAFSQAKKCKAEFELAVARDPRNLEVRSGLFQFFLQAPGIVGGGLDQARSFADETLRIDEATGHRMLVAVFRKEKDLAAAEAEAKRALELAPADPDAHAAAAATLLQENKADEALAEFRRALELDAGDPGRHLGIASALLQKGAIDEAISTYRSAIAMDARFVPAFFRLAEALEKKGDKDGAAKSYRQCLALRPRSSYARNAQKRLKKLGA